jgi:metal-responsive CopG/Arc/MetJ family transcriptional regulator
MSILSIEIPDELLQRLEALAREHSTSLDELVQATLLDLIHEEEDDEPSKEEILQNMKASLKEALSGKAPDALDAIAELRRELDEDAD